MLVLGPLASASAGGIRPNDVCLVVAGDGFGFAGDGLLPSVRTTRNETLPPTSWSARGRPWCRLSLVIGAIVVVAEDEDGAFERACGPREDGDGLGLGPLAEGACGLVLGHMAPASAGAVVAGGGFVLVFGHLVPVSAGAVACVFGQLVPVSAGAVEPRFIQELVERLRIFFWHVDARFIHVRADGLCIAVVAQKQQHRCLVAHPRLRGCHRHRGGWWARPLTFRRHGLDGTQANRRARQAQPQARN